MPRLLALLAASTLLASASPAAIANPSERPVKAFIHKQVKKKQPARKRAKVKAPKADWDRDGLNNRYERKAATRPRVADTDSDGVFDGREDRDGDAVANGTEQLAHTSPRLADTDRDGTADGEEDLDLDGLPNRAESLLAWHPRRADTDGDGRRDGDENPGTVFSVTGDSVTIALFTGGELTAAVTEFSEVLCAGGGTGPDDPVDEEIAEEDEETVEEEDLPDEPEERWAALGGCAVTVGALVYEAEVESFDGRVEFVALDLVGP